MQKDKQDKFRLFGKVYAKCSQLVPEDIWQQLVARAGPLEHFADSLRDRTAALALPGFLDELARMEFDRIP